VLSALINHYSVATVDTNSGLVLNKPFYLRLVQDSKPIKEIFELLKHLRLHVLISLNPDGHRSSREAASTNPKGIFFILSASITILSSAPSVEKLRKDMFAGYVDATTITMLI